MSERQLVMWDSEITREPDGSARVIARKPLHRMSIKKAAEVLGCTTQTISRLYQQGILGGWKPGENPGHTRKDGRKSNAKVVLDAGSVLRHKAAVTQAGYLG
jgi:excisionase family DNA binding protein